MEKIIIKNDVHDYLEKLVENLFEKEYFGFEQTAIEYVDKIYDFIYNELTNTRHRITPNNLLNHGSFYTKYSAGRRTAWYVFFNKKDNRYVIKYITNNHVATAAFLKGL